MAVCSVSTKTENALTVLTATPTKVVSSETLAHVSCCLPSVNLPSSKCSRDTIAHSSNTDNLDYRNISFSPQKELDKCLFFSASPQHQQYLNNEKEIRLSSSQNECDRNGLNEEMVFNSSASMVFDVAEKESLLQYNEDEIRNLSTSADEVEVNTERFSGVSSPSKKRSSSSINEALISHICSVTVDRPSVPNVTKTVSTNQSDCSVFLPPQNRASSFLCCNFDYVSVKVYSVRLLIGCLIFMLSIFIQGLCSVLSDQFYKTGEPRLKDRVHDALGGKRPEWLTTEVVNGFCLILTFSSIIRFVVFTPWQLACAIWTRFLWCVALLYTLRGIAIVVTTLPCPVETCIPLKVDSFGGLVRSIALMSFGQVYECTDMIVSGHTLFMTSMLMLWVFYSYKTPVILCVVFLYWLWLLIIINISFFHYTVDIVIAVVFAVCVWSIYHMVIDTAAAHCLLKRQKNESFRTFAVNAQACPSLSFEFTTPTCLCMEQERFITRCLIGRSLMKFVIFIEALNYRMRRYLWEKKQRESANALEVDGITLDIIQQKKGEFALFSVEEAGGAKGNCIDRKVYTYQNKMDEKFSCDEMQLFYQSYGGNGKFYWGNIIMLTRKCFRRCCDSRQVNYASSNAIL